MSERVRTCIVASVLLSGVVTTTAAAQTQTAPPGSIGGLFGGSDQRIGPGRTSHQVSTWFDLGAGVDRNVGSPSDPTIPSTGNSVDSTTAGSFRYWVGNSTRSLETVTNLYRTSSRLYGSTSGGEFNTNGNFGQQRRTGGTANFRVANQSARLFGAFGPALDALGPPDPNAVPVADVSPPNGIVENRWLSIGGGLNAFHNWTPRQRTYFQYSQTAMEQRGADTANNLQMGFVQHDWSYRPNAALITQYRFERLGQRFVGVDVDPIQVQSAEAGFRFSRHLSPIRTFTLTMQGGVTQLLSVASPLANLEGDFEPRGSVTASYNLARQWLLSGSVSRGVTALTGVSVDVFNNTFGSIAINGVLVRRLTLAVASTWSRGSSISATSGEFVAADGTATIQYGFRYGGVFAGVTRYKHELTNILNIPGAIPSDIDRYSVRSGITIWLPLFGAF